MDVLGTRHFFERVSLVGYHYDVYEWEGSLFQRPGPPVEQHYKVVSNVCALSQVGTGPNMTLSVTRT